MQAIKHDAHLLFSRVVLPGCPPDIADKRLGRRRVSTRSVATQLEWCETNKNSCLVTNKGIAAYVVRRPKTVASPGQPARLIQRQKFSAKKKNGHPGVGAWPEGCWPKASRQQWRHFGTSAMLGIECKSYGVGVHILFYRRQRAFPERGIRASGLAVI